MWIDLGKSAGEMAGDNKAWEDPDLLFAIKSQ